MSKDGREFSKIEKCTELSHTNGVLAASCDEHANFGVSLRKDRTIQLWKIEMKIQTSKVKKLLDHEVFGHGELSVTGIHSIET